tara:strand:- start:155195 stop:155773 length:579 start_codon:yes stop_codon:yes gene_type:complete
MKLIKLLTILVLATFISACTTTTQPVQLKPTLKATKQQNIGQGKEVAVTIDDARKFKSIGKSITNTRTNPTVPVNISGDVADTLQKVVDQGLSQYGFKSSEKGATKLKVDLSTFSYKATEGTFKTSVIINTVINVTATNGNKTYHSSYEANRSFSGVFTPSNKDNAKNINLAFSDVINKMMDDKSLMNFLAK